MRVFSRSITTSVDGVSGTPPGSPRPKRERAPQRTWTPPPSPRIFNGLRSQRLRMHTGSIRDLPSSSSGNSNSTSTQNEPEEHPRVKKLAAIRTISLPTASPHQSLQDPLSPTFRNGPSSSKTVMFAKAPASRSQSTSTMNGEVVKSEGVKFIRDVADLVLKSGILAGEVEEDSKVVNFEHPADLQHLLDLQLGSNGVSNQELLEICRMTIRYSVKTANPYFRNQLYGGADPYGIGASWLTEALNTNQHTFEVAPAFIIVERAIIAKVACLLQWKTFDGITCPGGSLANMYGIVAARYKKFPDIKTKGLFGYPRMTVFTSEDSHYSVSKAAHWLGLGTESVVKVPTDKWGRMIPEALEEAVVRSKEKGEEPFFINATAGTTVLGAFDPLIELSEVAKKHQLWLHVDAAWGGSALLSKKHKSLIRGISNADSIAWNPHKMIGAPLQTSVFLIREKDLLHHCNSASATYLFQQDKFYDVSFDTGDKSVQCGRKVDAFKFWMLWKAHGDDGLERAVDNAFAMAGYTYQLMRSRPGFRMVLPASQCTNIGFWYIPPSLRGREENDAWWEEVEKVAPEIKRKMTLEGTLMIGYQPLPHKKLRNFFRLVLTCVPELSRGNIDYIVNEIERIGSSM